MRNLRILLKKGETNIKFDEPLVVDSSTSMIIRSATVFWDFNNITDKKTHIIHGTDKIRFDKGYWTIGMIAEILKENGIAVKIMVNCCKVQLTPTKDLRILGLCKLLGFPEGATIAAAQAVTSPNPVNINLGMKFVCVKCNMIDGTRTSFSGKRDQTTATIPITTTQILKGSVTHFDNISAFASMNGGIYNELKFTTDHDIGEILLEIVIK